MTTIITTFIKVVTALVVLIKPTIKLISYISEYFNNKPESRIKLMANGFLLSCVLFGFLNGGAFFLFKIKQALNFELLNYIFDIGYIILIYLLGLIIAVLFMNFIFKERYKNKYAFFIAADYRKFRQERANFSKHSKHILEGVSEDAISGNYKIYARINKLEHDQKNLHKFSKTTKRYNVISITSFFTLPVLNLFFNLITFSSNMSNELFVYLIVMFSTFLIINTFIIYNDLRFEDGNIKQTHYMTKKHINMYHSLNKKK